MNTKLHRRPRHRSTTRRTRWPPPRPPATQVPAKVPATDMDPDAKRALPRTTRRGLQMVLRLLAFNAEAWLADHLNAYLPDNDEYRAITRATILRATAGTSRSAVWREGARHPAHRF